MLESLKETKDFDIMTKIKQKPEQVQNMTRSTK